MRIACYSGYMRLEHASVETLKQHIRALVQEHVSHPEQYRVFLFGSRVAGQGNERSDIDIGIEGSAPLPPAEKASLEDALESLPLLYKIELVDFSTVPDDFRREAKKHIELIP